MSGYNNWGNKKQKKNVVLIVFAVLCTVVAGIAAIVDSPVEIFAAEQEMIMNEASEGKKEDEQSEVPSVEEAYDEVSDSSENETVEDESDVENVMTDEQGVDEGTTETLIYEEGRSFETEEFETQEINDSKTAKREQKADNSVVKNEVDSHSSAEQEALEISVPIYNYNIVNVVVPTSYAVALNPYELPIRVNESVVSIDQVVARNYGIINKSTLDKIVTVTLMVEDQNGGKITFVDSKEAAMNADKDTYAIYLTVIPANTNGIKIGKDNMDVNKDTTAAELSDVSMTAAENCAVVLKEGKNQIAFKLSKAVYQYEDSKEINLDATQNKNVKSHLEITSLATDGTGVAAFTFGGAMNQHADWSKITNGIKVSVIYSYETAIGDEKIADGTSTVLYRNAK